MKLYFSSMVVVTPPELELCPGRVQVTTSQLQIEVQKPRVVFRTADGHEAPHTCTYFGEASSHVFPLGTHTVTCRAFDPTFGDQAMTVCEFTVRVKCKKRVSSPFPNCTYIKLFFSVLFFTQQKWVSIHLKHDRT